MGEGAGVVVLEELEHAKARGVRIYGEIKGYGMSGDAHHITAPAEDGDGGFRAMKASLDDAKLAASDIDYINAHGTSTPLGDVIEAGAVSRLFKDTLGSLSMSSTKSATGHLLGAAGAIEAIYSLLACYNDAVPPTLNLEDPADEVAGIDLVANAGKEKTVRNAMSNSFGFGGTNASLIVGKAE
jgi:3-oxoacyl-[acyl-carrier-protein] synthase II